MSTAEDRKINPDELLSDGASQTGISSREKIILKVQLEAQARLQETIELNALSTEKLTKRIGLWSIILSFLTLVLTGVGVYLAYLSLAGHLP